MTPRAELNLSGLCAARIRQICERSGIEIVGGFAGGHIRIEGKRVGSFHYLRRGLTLRVDPLRMRDADLAQLLRAWIP